MLYCLHRRNGTVQWAVDLATNRSDAGTQACFLPGDFPAPRLGSDARTASAWDDAPGAAEEASPSRGLDGDVLITFQSCLMSVRTGPDASGDPAGVEGRIRWQHTLRQTKIRSGVAVRWFPRRAKNGQVREDAWYIIGATDGQIVAFDARGKRSGDRSGPWRNDYKTPGEVAVISPPLVLGDDTVIIADINGVLTGLDASTGVFRWQTQLDEQYTLASRGPQFAVDGEGRIFVNSMNGVVAFGSRGGCAAGTEPNDSPASEQPELCSACGIGEHQPETGAGQGSCTLCREGAWSNAPKSTFCFVCKEEHWCEGGDTCMEGRDGAACAVCADNYWSMQGICNECPESSVLTWIFTSLAMLGILVVIAAIYVHAGAAGYASSTHFIHDVGQHNAPVDVRLRERMVQSL